MKHLLLIFLFFLLETPGILTGQISFFDFQVDYLNAGYTSQYLLSFSLETSLISTDFLKLIFPYALHSSSVNNIPANIQVTYNQYTSDLCSAYNQTSNPALIYQYTGNIYYISFLDSSSLPMAIQRNTIYTLIITIVSNIPSTVSGLYDYIQLYTVSSINSNAIIYDSNSLFASLAHTDTPSTN